MRILQTSQSLLLASLVSMGLSVQAADRPNIVYLVIDNVTFEHMGKAYGGKGLTPAMDSIAEEGVLFERMYVPTPLCVPSRYSILSGRYPQRSAGWPNREELEPDLPNLPKLLQGAGYTNGFIGKFHNDHSPEWKFSAPDGARITDPEVSEGLRARNEKFSDHMKTFGFDFVGAAGIGNGLVSSGNVDTHSVWHNLEWEVDAALRFLDTRKDQDGPFFLYMATKMFHLPVDLEGDLLGNYEEIGRYTEAGLLPSAPEVPMPQRRDIVAEVREKIPDAHRDQIYMRYLDHGVAAVLTRLRELDLQRNTIVFLISDNNQLGKSTVYEGGIHVPAAMRWPDRIPAGSKDAHIVSTLDIAVTFLDVAGVTPPDAMQADGKSILPLLSGASDDWEDVFMSQYGDARAITTPRWKYIALRYPDERQKRIEEEASRNPQVPDFGNANRLRIWDRQVKPHLKPSHLPYAHNIHRFWHESDNNFMKSIPYYPHIFDVDQLYDLEADPNEQVNLANDPAHASQLAEMQELLRAELERRNLPFSGFFGSSPDPSHAGQASAAED